MTTHDANGDTGSSNRTFWIIVLVSFVCSMPFNIFVIRADWDKANCVELLAQRNPAGYQQWLQDTENGENFSSPDINDFSNIWLTLSFFAGIPFYGFLASIYYLIVFCYQLFMMIPKILRTVIYFIAWMFGVIWLINKFSGGRKIDLP